MSRRSSRAAAFAILAAWVAQGATLAQFEPVPPVPPAPKIFLDPTVPDPRLKDLLAPKVLPGAAAALKPSELRLRGRVIGKDRAAAVLEIDGQTMVLPVGGEARSIKVKAITPDGVTVEVGPGREVKVLH